jgi:hypothetical protein
MATDTAYAIADAYHGQRRLGNISIAASHCHIVTDPAHPAYGMRTMPTMSRRKDRLCLQSDIVAGDPHGAAAS